MRTRNNCAEDLRLRGELTLWTAYVDQYAPSRKLTQLLRMPCIANMKDSRHPCVITASKRVREHFYS